jgi:hypothetical protein
MGTVHEEGGRGSGRPKDRIRYGKRTCMLVVTYKSPQDAYRKERLLESDGIMAIVRTWYSQWCVYKCGPRHK